MEGMEGHAPGRQRTLKGVNSLTKFYLAQSELTTGCITPIDHKHLKIREVNLVQP